MRQRDYIMAQKYNPELVRNLTPSFHKRSDLALNHAHATAFIQAIPGLVGFWPTAERDISGNSHTLTRSGTIKTIQYDNNIVPYVQYDRAGSAELYHLDNADLSITGTESYVGSGSHGLTMGGWWQFGRAPSVREYLMSKWDSSPNQSYRMYKLPSDGKITFALSVDGINTTAWLFGIIPPQDTWFFLVCRWIPSTETKLYYGLATDNNLTTLTSTGLTKANIADTSARFQLGSQDAGSDWLDGRSSMSFLIRGNVPNIYIETIFDLTSPLFAAT